MTDRELRQLVLAEGPAAAELCAAAEEVRRKTVGEAVQVRGIVEFSSYCRCQCLYCGLRADNAALPRFRLTPEEVLEACRQVAALGFGTVVLQSGEDLWWTAGRVAELIGAIKLETALAITLSLGEREEGDYRLWREAGADRYLLKHETANRGLYERLHPGASVDQRRRCHDMLFALGYQVGSGCLIGLPGQTAEILVEDLRYLEQRQFHMVGSGPLIPHPQTPLRHEAVGSIQRTLNVTALTRLLIPDVMMPATTALETAVEGGLALALGCGANVLMPNLTPRTVASAYEIYPGKKAPGLTLEAEIARTHRVLEATGRPLATGPGHSPRRPAGL